MVFWRSCCGYAILHHKNNEDIVDIKQRVAVKIKEKLFNWYGKLKKNVDRVTTAKNLEPARRRKA